jgi:hypothetical protein
MLVVHWVAVWPLASTMIFGSFDGKSKSKKQNEADLDLA